MNNALTRPATRYSRARPERRLLRLGRAVLTALPLLVSVPSAGAQEPTTALVPKVLLVGIDGVRPDVMRRVATPNINELLRNGAFSDRAQTGLPTLSGPSWTSMLTGVWKEKHGVLSNEFPFPEAALTRYPDFLTRIERLDPGLRTFAAADWTPLLEPQEDGEERGDPVLSVEIDARISLDGSKMGWAAADERAVEAAEAELRENDPAALFVYLGNPDEVSHHTGSIEDEYRASIGRADRHIGRLMAAVRARPTHAAENWLILVSTDHGRRPDGGHGGTSDEERTIFFLASGPSARQGTILTPPRIVDVAATALAHLGFAPREEWGLDGEPVGLVGW